MEEEEKRHYAKEGIILGGKEEITLIPPSTLKFETEGLIFHAVGSENFIKDVLNQVYSAYAPSKVFNINANFDSLGAENGSIAKKVISEMEAKTKKKGNENNE